MTDYERVLFIDADVLPLCNLDYLCELSMKGTLMDSVVIATGTEPANGGFFMLRPGKGEYDRLMSIVNRQYHKAVLNGSHAFDPVLGLGHAIEAPDEWVNV
jgi:hypothetical protein